MSRRGNSTFRTYSWDELLGAIDPGALRPTRQVMRFSNGATLGIRANAFMDTVGEAGAIESLSATDSGTWDRSKTWNPSETWQS